MYSTENYVWGLLAYLLGFLILLPIGWFFTGKIPWKTTRDLTRLFFIVLALAPAKAYTDMHFLAPAWIVITFEIILPSTDAGAVRPLLPLMLFYILALGGYFFLRYRKGGRGNDKTATASGKTVAGAGNNRSAGAGRVAPKFDT